MTYMKRGTTSDLVLAEDFKLLKELVAAEEEGLLDDDDDDVEDVLLLFGNVVFAFVDTFNVTAVP